jgi:hypothetical protein
MKKEEAWKKEVEARKKAEEDAHKKVIDCQSTKDV